MRIAVFPHTLELGGSQLNAIELAAAVRDLGHEVVVAGQPGVLERRIEELDLEFVALPNPRRRPSPRLMGSMLELVRERRIDLVHGYEWTTGLECGWGVQARTGVPAVVTVMSMAVAPFLPRTLPLVVGTEQIGEHERRSGRTDVTVLEPPVDAVGNAPDAVPAEVTEGFRREYGVAPGDLALVCVTRLSAELKLEGLLTAADVVGDLVASGTELHLIVVGDGPARAELELRAARANQRAGRTVVTLTGELADPRPAYAAADIALGMGGSALRAMAFAKPLVVQGERGFWRALSPQTATEFLWTGWYGVGEDPSLGADRLRAELAPLLVDKAGRAELGRYSRNLLESRFSLSRAGQLQADLYERVLSGVRSRSGSGPARRPGRADCVAAGRLARHEITRRIDRLRGAAARDDFNARPVAATDSREGPRS